jgi:large conductance mechanosensitive channel
MFKEFKEFAMRGSVVDLAVGIIIGGAFGTIVSSLVNDILMPPIGLILGGLDFKDLKIPLQADPAVAINYGLFINAVINFLIIAFALFMVIRAMNKLQRAKAEAPAPAPTTKECPQCLMTIPLNAKRCGHCTTAL